MKTKIEVFKLEKADLRIAFALLDPLLKRDKNGRRRKQTTICDEYGWSRAVYSQLLSGKITLGSYRDKVAMVARALRVEFCRDHEGQIELAEAMPTISQLLEDWIKSNRKYVHHYLYHYVANRPLKTKGTGADAKDRFVPESTIRHAHLILNFATRSACFVFYSSAKPKEKKDANGKTIPTQAILENKDSWVVARYHGKFILEDGHCYIHYSYRYDDRMEDKTHHQSLNVFHANENRLMDRKPILGSFASIGPAAGICVIEKMQQGHILHRISNQRVNPEIHHLLLGKTYSLRNQRPLFDLSNHKKLLAVTSELNGNYVGFSLANTKGQEAISVIRFRIEDGFRIYYQTANGNHDVAGYIFRYDQLPKEEGGAGVISAAFFLEREVDAYRLRMDFQIDIASEWHSSGLLVGVYSGIGMGTRLPSSGRVLLSPTTQAYDRIPADNVLLSDKEAMNNLTNTYRYLLPLFSGYIDDFHNSPLMHKDRLLLEYWYQRENYGRLIQPLRRFGGYYLTFRRSSRHDRVYQRLIYIDAQTGKAERYIEYDEKEGWTKLTGRASVVNNLVLAIDFDLQINGTNTPEPTTEVTSRLSNIFTARDYWEIGEIKSGVTNRLNAEAKPVGFKEVYEKIDPDSSPFSRDQLLQDWSTDEPPLDIVRAEIVLSLLEAGKESVLKGG